MTHPRTVSTSRGPAADLADPAFWKLPPAQRLARFAELRQEPRPVFFTERRAGRRRPEQGFYALVRHADVLKASRLPRVFASAPGATSPEPAGWVRVLFGDSMVNLDGADHTRLRRIVQQAFTPRLLAATEASIQELAVRIVDDMVAERPDEFVSAVAGRMSFEVICAMLGVPDAYRHRIARQIDRASEHAGVRRGLVARLKSPGKGLRALARMELTVARLGRERRRRPTGDLISALVSADVEGQRLTYRQLGSFFSLLLVAGVETTRNAIAHALALLTDNPDQLALLLSDFERYADGAVDEIVRHSTPIIQFRRTVVARYTMAGHTFLPGDKVMLLYASANRDATVFEDPDAFSITRDPNPHLGYGGGGPHFCLGAHLARLEIKAVLRELLTRPLAVRALGEPELGTSNFDHRVRKQHFAFDVTKP
ncbi:cytochrome P450 [Streptomyces sp. NBC_00083]|uniref:cytochrome P450 n=1 Tax=Streptomyces sp. NBC_00083 TaxID=2975647 RepID=UPI002250DF69|nr:cytochrome P450 [Streptomyces sp. NBC_00083]MCX5381781.1 cytochrome P450 [Streptomyces sp. NBC_00083]